LRQFESRVVLQTVAAYVRRDRISNLYSVNLEVCEIVESRVSYKDVKKSTCGFDGNGT
jgi:hypothetical protein